MNKYRRLLGSSRGGHFKEPRRKKLKFTSSQRRQSLSLRGRYGKLLLQKIGGGLWAISKIVLIAGTAAWVLSMGLHAARQTKTLDLKSVVYEGAIPEALPQFLPFKPGQNIFSIKPSKWEVAAKAKFSEIEEISIYRTLFRNVVVDVTPRTPIALVIETDGPRGVDKNGVVFPMKVIPVEKLPSLQAQNQESRNSLAAFLIAIKSGSPELHKKIESLSLENGWMEVGLGGGVVVEWGRVDEKNIFDKAKNILRLLTEFSPTKIPAKLRFVTDDRIVMDGHWEGK